MVSMLNRIGLRQNSKISTLQRIADICILFVMLERFCMGESLGVGYLSLGYCVWVL